MPVSSYISRMRAHIGSDLLLLPGCSAVVRDPDGRVLLARRRDNGRWSLPAGMIDPGEQPADAAVREVFEETGVRIRITRLGGVASHPVLYPNGDNCQYLHAWFDAEPIGGDAHINDEESTAVGWFSPAELPDIDGWSRLRIETTADPDAQTWYVQPGEKLPDVVRHDCL
jgi:8-oxo-dGTP diphosphatase